MSKEVYADNLGGKAKKALNTVSRFNIGIIIFLVFVLYIVISVIRTANKTHLSIYEVPLENIATDDTAVGIILRDETSITSDSAGYVNYYIKSGTRVEKNKTVYSLDENKQLYNALAETDLAYSLSEDDVKELKKSISEFADNYNDQDYSEIYDLSGSLDVKIRNISDSFLLDNLNKILEETGYSGSLSVYTTPSAGVVSYYTDEYENITLNDISTKLFENADSYKVKSLYDTDLKESGSTIYKLLTNEEWSIVLNLTEEQYNLLKDSTKLSFTINRDKLSLSAPVTVYPMEGGYFARIDLDKYMIRYYDERFLTVTLDLPETEGLKIPNTAILTKNFYQIPIEYLTQGGDSTDYGVMVPTLDSETGKVVYDFVSVEIYYQTDEYAYIDESALQYGTYIYNTDTESQFQVSLEKPLEGVYCVNKGYAQFRRIEKMYIGDEYTIVSDGLSLSISEHDHIALDASKIEEAAIIY